MIPLLKAFFPLLAATLTSAQCDRTCDTLYFAGVSPPSYPFPSSSSTTTTTSSTFTKTILTTPLPSQYDDLPSGTVLTFANPYQGIQYSGYTVRDFTGNGVLTIPSGPNALIAINPTLTLPVNRRARMLHPIAVQEVLKAVADLLIRISGVRS